MKQSANESLKQRDLRCVWHPCTQMHDHEQYPLVPIERGQGIYLYDFEGKSYVDGISSWWVNLFGHSHPYLNEALQTQVQNLEHTLLAGFTHEPIIRLSERLIDSTPAGLDMCFYADNGSSAIEVALKMSFHAELLRSNAAKPLFASLQNSYHGETIGALSVGDVGLYKAIYAPLLLQNVVLPVPEDSSQRETERAIEGAKAMFASNRGRICALVLEPLVQCAGGMRMHSPTFVRALCTLAREEGIAIIFDEIAVGFGRTGSFFALEQCDVVPDYLCLSKGITGGYLPLSVVLLNRAVYELFYAPYTSNKNFLHSHSYTGNALAASVANAVFELFERENTLTTNRAKAAHIAQRLANLARFSIVKNPRQTGMIAAFDLNLTGRAGMAFYVRALELGVLLRPLGNVIYFMPPYIITIEQIDVVFDTIERILGELG